MGNYGCIIKRGSNYKIISLSNHAKKLLLETGATFFYQIIANIIIFGEYNGISFKISFFALQEHK